MKDFTKRKENYVGENNEAAHTDQALLTLELLFCAM